MSKRGTLQPAKNFIRNGVEGNITKALKVSSYHINALLAKAGNAIIDVLRREFSF